MSAPILATKLYIPPPRPSIVPRPNLIAQLNEGLHLKRKLTLISAPAGFGKTTLVSEWIAGGEWPAAWLSLDAEDADPIHFLTYLVAALQTIEPDLGEGIEPLLQAPQPPAPKAVLTTLLNEVISIPGNFVLVLDDYHVVDSGAIDNVLTFLLEHLPAQMHLVITTRENPQLPLPRIRARGQLTELRAADLRFTTAEAAAFLNQVMGLNLSAEEVGSLDTRTEGWIAGLQLAALSMRGREDIPGFIKAFSGDHRYIVDYLVAEVLQLQPESVSSFLLQTSILDRLCGPLCDAVTGQGEGSRMLETLESGNQFVVPLDDRRQWYRYHHLFADVLQVHLRKEQPQEIPKLHQRASAWYEQNGSTADAIRHALAGEVFERAAALIELAWPAIFKGFRPATWLAWVRALPDELVLARPVLCVGCAWTLLDGGELEAVEAYLRAAERWLDTDVDGRARTEPAVSEMDGVEMVVVNEEVFRSLPASIASARAYLAQARGDVTATMTHARRALELFPEEEKYQRGIAAMFLGLAYWTRGDLAAAYQSISESVASLNLAGNRYFQIVGTVFQADIRMAQGQHRAAASIYEGGLQFVAEQGESELLGTADIFVGLAELDRERDNLEAAAQYLVRGHKVAERAVIPGSESRLLAAMARIKAAEGDLDATLDLLSEAERLYKRRPAPDLSPLAAMKARLWLRQGRLHQAQDWARERGLSAADDLSYLREFEHITLARVRIAEYKNEGLERALQEALALLARLLKAAEKGGRLRSVVEIRILQALAHQAEDDISTAVETLKGALGPAKTEGYCRIFVDEGEPMQKLLAESLKHNADPDYVTQLLAALNRHLGGPTAEFDPNQMLVEPLSKRELEVLRLLAEGHSNQAVAEELIIALSTVKKHVNNIFGKLGVSNRTQAVRRARELDLL